ncbi:hypothetical protein [Brachybacterium nesterenkovii]|uniref:hypothetical protein n=1 Tax=Brachybacterium nesterenkovii TaxID=47847 RepID=UPI00321BBF78
MAAQDRNVSRMDQGDFVLFTAQNMVRGIGEVGARFQNAAFADSLWAPDADRGSWWNVFSLQSFTPVEIPHDELRSALGTSSQDNFMGMRIVSDPERVAAVVEAFGLDSQSQFDRSVERARDLAMGLGSTEVVAPEANNTSGSSYSRAAGEIIFRRAESALAEDYRAQLSADADVQRLRIDGRLSDLYVRGSGQADLIEARKRPNRRGTLGAQHDPASRPALT